MPELAMTLPHMVATSALALSVMFWTFRLALPQKPEPAFAKRRV